MRVAPIYNTPVYKPNFNGLLVKIHENSYDDNAQQTSVHSVNYDYYPFKDENSEDIRKVFDKYSKYELEEKPAPAWNILYQSFINVNSPLPITAEEYKKAIVE